MEDEYLDGSTDREVTTIGEREFEEERLRHSLYLR